MKRLLFIFFVWSFLAQSQSYSIHKIATNTNGTPGPMKGVPGDVFASTITFKNSSSSVIYVIVDRYKNDIPPYWAVCYCYIQCHSPREDSIMVEIQPFSTTDVTLQFKTDSVNPGIAKEGFTIYQVGFENNTEDVQMTASTLNDVGIFENQSGQHISIYPNPSYNTININLPYENISTLKVIDISGGIKEVHSQVNSSNATINTLDYPIGIYFVQIETERSTYTQRFIKN